MSTGMLSKFFSRSEMQCRCGCGKCNMDKSFLWKLDLARDLANTPFNITSGVRCQRHNKEVGSTSRNHVEGHAADISATSGPERGKILKGLYKAGFTRVGIHDKFIHVDDMDLVESCWLY